MKFWERNLNAIVALILVAGVIACLIIEIAR